MFQSQAFAESAMTDEPPIPRVRRIRSARYYERKAAEVCTYGSAEPCPRPPAADSSLCVEHLERARGSRARSAQVVRDENRAKGLCAYCGRVKSETYACAGCVIRSGAVPTRTVENAVGNTASLTPTKFGNQRRGGRWRAGTTDSDSGALRYRGLGARGQVPNAVLDEQDCKQALELLERGRRALAYANSEDVRALSATQQREAVRAALSLVALSGRFLDDLLDRRKYKP